MIDPITLGTAISTATTAYSQIKKLIQTGREIEELSDTVGKWMSAVSDIDNINKSSSNPSTFDRLFNGSVEEVAMKSYSPIIKMKFFKPTAPLHFHFRPKFSRFCFHYIYS